MNDEIKKHIRNQDKTSMPYRERRMEQLLEIFPASEGFMLFGGTEASILFNEVRLGFVDGLFYSTILSSLALVELTVSARLRAMGMEITEGADIETILNEARHQGFLEAAPDAFDEYRRLREAYSPMRKPWFERPDGAEAPPFEEQVVQDAAAALSMLPPIVCS
jgi:HEPN domain-containing protein